MGSADPSTVITVAEFVIVVIGALVDIFQALPR